MSTSTTYLSLPGILIDGEANISLSEYVVAVVIEESTDGLFRCELILNNYGEKDHLGPDYLFFDRSELDFGSELGVKLGPYDEQQQVFSGRITAIEAEYLPNGGSRMVVLAEDRLQDLRMTRRTRSFEDMSDRDIIEQISEEHGLATDVNVNGPTHRSVTQLNQSDLAFIRERARAVGAEVWVTESTLHVNPRTFQNNEPIDLAYGASLIAFQVRADLAHQCTDLTVSGWDVIAKEAIEEIAAPDVVRTELGDDLDGGNILLTEFGERRDSIVHTVPLNAAEARSIAEARYREKARRFVTGSAEADGDTRIRAGISARLSGLGQMFDGMYYVTYVRHLYDSHNGFHTEFDVERPGIGS